MPRLDGTFPMVNICFYKTSGRSNGSIFGGMWVPTPGFVNEKFKKVYDKPELPIDNIIKGTDMDLEKVWAYTILSQYLRETYNLELNMITGLNLDEHDDIIQEFINLFPFIRSYETLISNYFCSLDQLVMSAFLGSGLWTSNGEFSRFRAYLLGTITHPSIPALNDTASYFDRAERDFESLATGLEDTKRFLIENNAQICVGECIKPKRAFRYGSNNYTKFIISYEGIITMLIRKIFTLQKMYRKSNPEKKIAFSLKDVEPVLDLCPYLLPELEKILR